MPPSAAPGTRAAIAGLVIAAALSIIDIPGFRALARHDRPGLVVAAAAAVTVLLTGVLTGVAAALAVQAATALIRRARRNGWHRRHPRVDVTRADGR